MLSSFPLSARNIVRGAVSVGLLAGAVAVQAEMYAGAQVNLMKIDRGAVSDAELTALTLRGGMVLHELVSAELRLGAGLSDDSYRNIDVENDFFYGAYARLTPPLEGPLQPYLIGGYGYVENEINGTTQRDDGSSYGGGFDLGVGQHSTLNVEYLRLVDNDFGKQELIGLGVNYSF